jgi:mono/diheme cytochrome c family protein
MSTPGDDPVLARLLGPSEPQLTCEQCIDQLDRYVELELAGADADRAIPGLRAHLQGCVACHEDHESLKALLEAPPNDATGACHDE